MEKIIKELQNRLDTLLKEKDQVIVAIDGSCASGKSTLARRLAEEYDCNLFRVDDFFLRPEQRTEARLMQTGGNVDYERFQEEVLLPLKKGEPFVYRPFDCSTGRLGQPIRVVPKRINIVEGSYSHHPYFGEPYDLKVFLLVSPEIRAQRILRRPSFLQKRFFEEWIPMEQKYFSQFHIAENSDLAVVPADNQ